MMIIKKGNPVFTVCAAAAANSAKNAYRIG